MIALEIEAGAAPAEDLGRFEQLLGAFVRAAATRYGEPARELLARYSVTVRSAEAVPEAAKGLEEGQVGKAWTRFRRSARKGDRQGFVVAVFPGADTGTLPHEAGHIFLEVLGDLAELDAAPGAAAEYRTILAWLGAAAREDLLVEQFEQFAEGFAAYLCEGPAPCAELEKVVDDLQAWCGAHRQVGAAVMESFLSMGLPVFPARETDGIVRSALGIGELPPTEVQAVFARMLSTGEERPR